MNRGDIVLVNWPFSDRTGSKVRPALVVQADQLNLPLDDTVISTITSSRRRNIGSSTQVLIKTDTTDGKQSGLRMDSIVQCENLLTIDQKFIIRTLGTLSDQIMQQVDNGLRAVLNL